VAELTIDQALQQGVEAHKAGQVQEADRLYTAILKAQPKHPDANHNMGVLAVGVSKIEQALPFFKTALEANPATAQFWLSYIDALIKLGKLADAKAVLDQARSKGAKGDGFDKLEQRLKEAVQKPMAASKIAAEPQQDQLQSVINLYSQGQLQQALRQAETLVQQFPQSAILFNIQGAALKGLGQLGLSVEAYNKALAIKPDYAEAYYNMGNALKDQGKLEEAIEAYNKALAIKPDYAEAYNNMGVTLKDQGKLEEAIEAYSKALAIKPDYAEAHNNMGLALKDQGKLEEAIEAYNKALAIKPDSAEAYYNMGNALKDQGKLEEAIEAYNKALAIKPDYAEAHRHLSILTKYTSDTAQICEVEALLQQDDLGDSDRCNLLYTNAKMQEDLGNLSAAYASYVAGGGLRQKLLKYEFVQDEHLFGRIKRTAPKFKDVALNVASEPIKHTPIFILGMPRSGTTLVEQIVSSHTEVTGAGELSYVSQSGTKLVAGITAPTLETVSAFRERYLTELAKRAEGQAFITDKMPQNFRYIALICAAFPEAKIVHVQRNAEATCWSNFKHYFASKGLGYSYSLDDTVAYYGLYKDLMHFWSQTYDDRIYNLDYDKLTEDQEPETRRLIEYLGLNWEDACLSPQNNKRSVKTASQQQVRKKVYKGSSQAWRKYESFLNGVFDELKT
jgi:tetratricopeptide (TPR) repeat protein